MDDFVYLDHNATTPLDPAVLEVMMPYLTDQYGNASSLTHSMGRVAAAAVDQARERVASLIGAASTSEITFTAGATEAVNMAIKGVFDRYQLVGKHFITCKTEHKAVLDTFAHIEKRGAEVTYLDVNSSGHLDLGQLDSVVRPETVLITFMSANNETGVCHPITEIAGIAEKHGVLFFCDATQSIGKVPLRIDQIPIDILCLSGHKMYGPKGIGAIYIRKKNKRIQIENLLHGGNQEHGLRAGTLNVPGIVGLGHAVELGEKLMKNEALRLGTLRNRMEQSLLSLPEIRINGSQMENGDPGTDRRLPHVSNVTIRHLRASTLMTHLPGIGLSTGSACVSGSRDPSHVLTAMGIEAEDAHSSIRISLGRYNTEKEIDGVLNQLKEAITNLRADSPNWQLFEKGLIA